MGEMKTYEENDAVKYILSNLPSDVAEKYSDDDIFNIIQVYRIVLVLLQRLFHEFKQL